MGKSAWSLWVLETVGLASPREPRQPSWLPFPTRFPLPEASLVFSQWPDRPKDLG